MTEIPFQSLPARGRRDALRAAQNASGRRAVLLEKDIWIVHTLSALFSAPFGTDIVFKGGTSLSKAYQAIRRFSEDIDVTYDIRAFAPDLVSGAGAEALPPTRSQEQRWTRILRLRLDEWIRGEGLATVEEDLRRAGTPAAVSASGDRLLVRYASLFDDQGFVRPEVIVEFGARATGEPHERREVTCDAAPHLSGIAFPTASTSTMLPERTCWEKATAMHVFCRQQRRRGERLSRHWHDIVRLDEVGYATRALADRALALSVARHKAVFFREKDASGQWIDYEAAVSGDLQLVPDDVTRAVLKEDYERMVSAGMLLDDDEPFDLLIERCADLEARANEV